MSLPVRCFTCGKVLGNKWLRYEKLCQEKSCKEAMDELGLTRYCCRRMMLTSVDSASQILEYNAAHPFPETPYISVKTKAVDSKLTVYLAR
jgi:DNA-directed RNA polymerase I, II, and III subunit RPABC5